jgi:predicted nucleic acid-binding protein
MIYLDSVCLIYAVEGSGPRRQRIHRALAEADATEVFAISPLVVLECLVKPFRDTDLALEEDYRAAFRRLELLPVPDAAYEIAARLRAAHGIKTPDALHWAIAHTAGCSQMWTGDAALVKATRGFARDLFADS